MADPIADFLTRVRNAPKKNERQILPLGKIWRSFLESVYICFHHLFMAIFEAVFLMFLETVVDYSSKISEKTDRCSVIKKCWKEI